MAIPGSVVASGKLVTPGGAQGPPGAGVVPPGAIMDYAGATAPSGWLFCDGSAVSRTTYSALYTALGGASSPWGQGDGSTTFNVPDGRGRAAIGAGQGASLTARALAATGGEENHLLLATELASHTHTASSTQGTHTHTDSGHSHVFYGVNVAVTLGGTTINQVSGPGGATVSPGVSTGNAVISTVSAGAITTTVNATAAGVSHNNMQPFVVFNRIIKT